MMALIMLMTFMVVLMAAFTIVIDGIESSIDGRISRIKSINSSFDSNEQQYQVIPKSIK